MLPELEPKEISEVQSSSVDGPVAVELATKGWLGRTGHTWGGASPVEQKAMDPLGDAS
jgi:hypothetical protein